MLSVTNKPFILSVIMMNVIIIVLFILSVKKKHFILSAAMVNVVMLSVVYAECHK